MLASPEMAGTSIPRSKTVAIQQGWNDQTPAIRALLGDAMRVRKVSTSGKRRKRRNAATAKKSRAVRKAKAAKPAKRGKKNAARLVKGSAAAKRFMARIRKMRKK